MNDKNILDKFLESYDSNYIQPNEIFKVIELFCL